jgi:uncharacterized membrane protein
MATQVPTPLLPRDPAAPSAPQREVLPAHILMLRRAFRSSTETMEASTAFDFTAPVPVLTQMARTGILLFVIGFSLALSVRFAFASDLTAYVKSNTLGTIVRKETLAIAGGAGALFCLLPGLYLLWHRTQAALDRISRAAAILSPLLLAFSFPIFLDWRVFKDQEWLCVVSASLVGLGLERAFRTSFAAVGLDGYDAFVDGCYSLAPRLMRRLPLVLLGLLGGGFALYFSYYSVQHHYNLMTTSWDLAIFDNMMWNLLRGKWFKASPDLGRVGSHIQYHATFDAYLFLPIYALRQKADTLLVMQATLAGLGVIPLYLLVKRRLANSLIALGFCYCYAIYSPLHSPIFYDFHFLTTAPFFIGWVLYAFETNRRGWLLVAFIAAVLLREDQSATLATAALFFLVSGQRPWWALFGGALSGLLFVLLKFVIMPAHVHGISKETFSWMYSGLVPTGEGGFGAVLRTVFSNPAYTLSTLLVQEKAQYIMKLFAPVLFLSLRDSRTWLLHLAPFIFTMLSTGYSPLVQTFFQYSSNWTSYVFFGAAAALSGWRGLPDARVRIGAAAAAMVVTSTLLSYNHGAIFQHNSFRGGFGGVKFRSSPEDKRNLNDLYALIALIPKTASVAATEHEAPHVSNREDCFTMRFGYDDADYLLVATAEARGGRSREEMEKALKTGQYGFVKAIGGFALWGKGRPHDRDAEGASVLGLRL